MRVLTLVLALAAVLPAGAQEPLCAVSAQVKELLASPAIRDQAWGAYLAGRLRLMEHRDVLMEKVRQVSKAAGYSPQQPEWWWVQAMLDALIEMKAQAPEDVLLG